MEGYLTLPYSYLTCMLSLCGDIGTSFLPKLFIFPASLSILRCCSDSFLRRFVLSSAELPLPLPCRPWPPPQVPIRHAVARAWMSSSVSLARSTPKIRTAWWPTRAAATACCNHLSLVCHNLSSSACFTASSLAAAPAAASSATAAAASFSAFRRACSTSYSASVRLARPLQQPLPPAVPSRLFALSFSNRS